MSDQSFGKSARDAWDDMERLNPRFRLHEADFTGDAASLWGDMLELGRPATYAEALDEFQRDDFGGNIADYYTEAGIYKGPCALGVSIENP
jgi:hypothetical protein